MTSPAYPGRLGQGDRCPHCGSTAGVSEDGEGAYACLQCGAPRILVNLQSLEGPRIARPGGERALLERVKAERARRAAWFVGACVVLGFGALGALLALGVFALIDLGTAASVALVVMVLFPIVFALIGFRQTKAAAARARTALEEARRVVAAELLAARPDLKSAEIAAALQVPEDQAIELAAHAQVGSLLGDETAPRYRVQQTEVPEHDAPEESRRGHTGRHRA